MMNEETSYTLRITMPKHLANEFNTRARYEFNDCRWLMVKFDMMLADLFLRKTSEVTRLDINLMKEELLDYVDKMFKENN